MRLEQEAVRQTSACSRARSAPTLAVGSMPKPHSAGEMVLAVSYLLAHLSGDAQLSTRRLNQSTMAMR